VIDRGTAQRSVLEIAEELDNRGITLTIAVNRHVFSLSCTCLADDFEPVLARLVQVGVPRDLVHPRGKIRSRLKRLPVFQHAKKYLLHQVLTQSAIGGEPQEEVEEHAVMAVEQNADTFHVAIANREHHQVICLGFHLISWPHRSHCGKPPFPQKVTGKSGTMWVAGGEGR